MHLLRLEALARLVLGLISNADCRCPCCWARAERRGPCRCEAREHARPSPASTAKWRPRLARWHSWRPGGKRSPGSFSRRLAQRVPFTRGQHLALLAAGARTASASSSLGYGRGWCRCHSGSVLLPLLFAERNERREVPHDLVRVASLHV
eukprot:tig00020911_g15764.t1